MSSNLIDVYDFDYTIYKGDASLEFWKYCITKHPALLLLFPFQLLTFGLMKMHVISDENGKTGFFSFLRFLKSCEREVLEFWESNDKNIAEWFQPNCDNISSIVISASPEFLLAPICLKIGVKGLIATHMDIHTGRISGKNCKKHEKVIRLNDEYGNFTIRKMYSDSLLDDAPLFKIAQERIHIVNGEKKCIEKN